jgi:integrase
VLVAASTGLRRGEQLALQWQDIDFELRTVNVRKSIWQQHLGPVKTEESEKTMPLDEEMIGYLESWRRETPYAQAGDWIFASARMSGRQPLWPDSLMRKYIARAAKRAGLTKSVSWHVFRHTFSTLLVGNGEDVKTAQSPMRHANPNITMALYTHPVSRKKGKAQSKIVEMIRPRETAQIAVMARGTA